MHFVILTVLLLLLIFGPQWWVRGVLARYSRQQEDFPGDGGELARHLLDQFGLTEVRVEATTQGDHYDPRDKTVRLTQDKLRGRSLTAIATAAHEVGHAIQDFTDYKPFRWRERLVLVAQGAEKIGSFMLFAVPILAGLTRAPGAGILLFLAGIATIGMGLLVQLATLPVEWDASFGKALPVLTSGGYINEAQVPSVRRILRACALTYVAASLAGLLNFWRWMQVLRR